MARGRGLSDPLLGDSVEMTDTVFASSSDERAYEPPVPPGAETQVVVHHAGPLDELLEKLDQQGHQYRNSFDQEQPPAELAEAIHYAQRPIESGGQINRFQRVLGATYRFVDTISVTMLVMPSHEAYSLLLRFSSVPIVDLIVHRCIHPAVTQANPNYPTKNEVLGRVAAAVAVGGIVEVVGIAAGNSAAYADFLAKPTGDNDAYNAVAQGLTAFGTVTGTETAVLKCRAIAPESTSNSEAQELTKKQHLAHHTTKFVLDFAQTEAFLSCGIINFHPMSIIYAELVRELVAFLVTPQPFERLMKDEKQDETKEIELGQLAKKEKLQTIKQDELLSAIAEQVARGEISDEELEGRRSASPKEPNSPKSESYTSRMRNAFFTGARLGKNILKNTRLVAITVAATTCYVVSEVMCTYAIDGCNDTSKVAGRAIKSATTLASYFVIRTAASHFFKSRCAKPATPAATPSSPANSPARKI